MCALKIPDAIRRFLREADFISLSTVDKNGQPSAVNKFMLKAEGDTIYIVDFIRGKTWKNLQYNPFISITVMDKDNLRDYQINGTAVILESGKEYSLLMKELSGREIRFATNRVIKGIQRMKPHYSFAFLFPQQTSIIKVRVNGIIEVGPTAQLKKNNSVIISEKKDSLISEFLSCFMRKAKYYLSQHQELTRLMGLFWVLSIGLIDYSTGYEVGVLSFYLIPIILVTWGLNKKAGLYLVFLSVVTWIVAEQMARGTRFSNLIIFWNATIRLTFFLIIVQLLSSLKVIYEKEQEFSSHDYLTGAVNSRCFSELMERELKRMLREKKSFFAGLY